MNSSHLLSVESLFLVAPHKVLLHNISFDVLPGETVCLVGESGSGKSLTLRSILGLLPCFSLSLQSGHIYFQQKNLLHVSSAEMSLIRKKHIGFVPQSPHASLNPLLPISRHILDVPFLNSKEKKDVREKAFHLLTKVGFSQPERIWKSRPHELSGGMKQRVLIALALLHSPQLLLLDEPTTALDVTLQSEVLDLLEALRSEFFFSMIFVTHDLKVVARIGDRVFVMQNGAIVERGPVPSILRNPSHPHTQELLNACLSKGLNQ